MFYTRYESESSISFDVEYRLMIRSRKADIGLLHDGLRRKCFLGPDRVPRFPVARKASRKSPF